MKKFVISDLDGTLLNKNHKISEKTKRIVKKLQDKGIEFAIATGRDIYDVRNILKEADIVCPVIGCNGGTFHDEKNNLIYEKFLEDDIAKKIFNFMLNIIDQKTVMHVIRDGQWYIFPHIELASKWDATHKKPHFVDEKDFEFYRINKIFITNEDNDTNKLKVIEKYILDNKLPVNYAYTFTWCFEIFPENLNKFVAIEKLLEIKGYKPEQVIAFGDGMNDYEMLSNVGKAYIMKNANYMLKDKLKDEEIIGFHYEDAVADKLNEIFELE